MKLKNKLAIILILVSLVPFIAGMIYVGLKTGRTIKESSKAFFQEYCVLIASDINLVFSNVIGSLESLTLNPDIQNFNWDRVSGMLDTVSRKSGFFSSFILVKTDGSYFKSDIKGNPAFQGRVTQNNTDPNATLSNLSQRDYFQTLVAQNTFNERRITISDPVHSLSTGQKQLVLGMSIIDDNDTTNGLLGVTITANLLEEKLKQLSLQLVDYFGEYANIAIFTNNRTLVSLQKYNFSEKRYVEEILNKKDNFALTDVNPEYAQIIDTILLNNISTVETFINSADKKEYSVTVHRIPQTNFYVSVFMPTNELLKAIQELLISVIVITLLALLLIIVISNFVGGAIARPLSNTANTLKDIASGSGDLTYRLKVVGNDETSHVAHFFNKFIETLHDMIGQIKISSNTMENLSGELQKGSTLIKNDITTISNNVSDLHFQTEEQSASVTETSSTIHEIAKNIESLTQQIEGQSASVNESSAAIQQMVSNINSISINLERAGSSFETLLASASGGRESMQNVMELVKDVSEQSEHLLETNQIVDAIASQTNLLAMNAAIEAAHAGEAGKGFAVVSDEIRKLAESSSEQSRLIETELNKAVATISTIVYASDHADKALQDITEQIKNANGLIQEIRHAMKEQNEGSRQVLEALDEIQNITVQIRDGSLEMNQGASMILKEMTRLEEISLKVQSSTQVIARSSDTIEQSVENIVIISNKNSDVVKSLNEITGRFKL